MLIIPEPVKLRDLPTFPSEERGARSLRWKGVSHHRLADTLLERTRAAGFMVFADAWWTNESQHYLIGVLHLSYEAKRMYRYRHHARDWHYSIGMIHDHKSRYGFRFYGGIVLSSGVGFITSNALVKRYATVRTVEKLDGMIDQTIEKIYKSFADAEIMVAYLKTTSVSREQGCRIILDVCAMKDMGFHLGKIMYNAWEAVQVKELRLWDLYKCVVSAQEHIEPIRQLDMMERVHVLTSGYSGGGNL